MQNIEQEDLDAYAVLFQQQPPLLQRFALETNRELIPPDKYREHMRGLNTKQRQAVNFHRRWCKDAVVAMKKGEVIKPYSRSQWSWWSGKELCHLSYIQRHCEAAAPLWASGCYRVTDSTHRSWSF